MPIEFRCTQCHRLLRTGDDTEGKQARCPECGMVMTVPGPGDAGPPSLAETIAGTGSPPAGPTPPPESLDNPYASPASFSPARATSIPFGDLQMYAASRLAGPATVLMVIGCLGLALDLLQIVPMVADLGFMGAQGARPGGDDWAAFALFGGMGIAGFFVSVVLRILVIVGAMKMKALESYGLAMTSAILALLPCGPCCLLSVPFGIWAIVVLSDGQVRAAFRS